MIDIEIDKLTNSVVEVATERSFKTDVKCGRVSDRDLLWRMNTMGTVREPKGVDFIISGGPMKPENATMVTDWLKANRAARVQRIEADALALPIEERARLAHRLIDSLTTMAPTELPLNNSQSNPATPGAATSKGRAAKRPHRQRDDRGGRDRGR